MKGKKEASNGSNLRSRISAGGLCCLILLTVLLSATGTYAWFSVNRKVKVNGFGLGPEAKPNLIISDSESSLSSLSLEDASPFSVSVSFGVTSELSPCTNQSGVLSYPSGGTVSASTGLVSGGSMEAIDAEDYEDFFIEKTVYIGSYHVDFINSALTLTIESVTHDSDDLDSYKAASVDVFLGEEATIGNFRGTVNVAGLDSVTNNGTAAKTSLELTLPSNKIPDNTEDAIAVTMRFYFDGALLKPGGSKTYVNAETVNTEEVNFSVRLTATEKN